MDGKGYAKVALATSLTALGGFLLYSAYSPRPATAAVACPEHAKLIIPPQRMAEILEDLKIHLLPYYIHYYNIIKQLQDDYTHSNNGDEAKALRSASLHAVKDKIKAELEKKTSAVEQQVIVDKHKLTKHRFIYSCTFYQTGTTELLEQQGVSGDGADPDLAAGIRTILEQEDRLFPAEKFAPVSKPDFQLVIPESLTLEVYIAMLKKIFACIRFEAYCKIRSLVREGNSSLISKGQLKQVLQELDIWSIRNKVFDLYGFAELNEPSVRTLIKAHLIFLSQDSRKFDQAVRDIRQSHQRYLTAILACDVFPGLDKTDPIASKDEDRIPDKFGSKWCEYERSRAKD